MKRVIRKNGNLIFEVDGREVIPAAYMSYCPKDADYAGFAAMGYRLFSYAIYVSDAPTNEFSGLLRSWEKGCWPAEDTFDFSALDAGMAQIAATDCGKDFFVILRININVPYWWREKYPDELITYLDGKKVMQSSASIQWRKDTCVFLDALREHISRSFYADNIIAWQIAAMSTEEWIHPREQFYELKADKPWTAYHRHFCREKYGTVKALNKAHGTHYTDFDELELPSNEEMAEKRDHGKNAKAYPRVRDAIESLTDSYAETISFFTRYVKLIHHNDIFCGAFYGYVGEFYDTFAHNATDRLFREPSIDFFAAPFAYVNGRAMGIDWVYRCPVHTADKLGKLFFMEADVRTHLTRYLRDVRPDLLDSDLPYFNLPVFFGPDTERQSCNNILRIFSKILISQHPFWWFDMWGGWYNNDTYHALHRRLFEIYCEKSKAPVKNDTQIALVLDEDSSYETANAVQIRSVFEQIIELSNIGATFDLVLINELDDGDVAKYDWFLCANPVSPAYEALRQKVAQAGKLITASGKGQDSAGEMIGLHDLQQYAEKAGVFLYSPGNIVFHNEKYLSVTATGNAGQIDLYLPDDEILLDLLTGETYIPENRHITLQAGFNDTFLFQRTEAPIC